MHTYVRNNYIPKHLVIHVKVIYARNLRQRPVVKKIKIIPKTRPSNLAALQVLHSNNLLTKRKCSLAFARKHFVDRWSSLHNNSTMSRCLQPTTQVTSPFTRIVSLMQEIRVIKLTWLSTLLQCRWLQNEE